MKFPTRKAFLAWWDGKIDDRSTESGHCPLERYLVAQGAPSPVVGMTSWKDDHTTRSRNLPPWAREFVQLFDTHSQLKGDPRKGETA